MRMDLPPPFVAVLGVEPGNAALGPDVHGRLDDGGIIEGNDIDAQCVLAVAAKDELRTARSAELALRARRRAVDRRLAPGVAEVIIGDRRIGAHRRAHGELADAAVTVRAPFDRTFDAVAQAAAMATAFKSHGYISNSHQTGTWSEGLSRPRTCLSMAERFR